MKTAYRILAACLAVVFFLGIVPICSAPEASAAEIEGAYINGLDYVLASEVQKASDSIRTTYVFGTNLSVSYVDMVIAVYDGSITSAWWNGFISVDSGYMLSWSPITTVVDGDHYTNYYRVYGSLESGFDLSPDHEVYFAVRGSFVDTSDLSVLQMRFSNNEILRRSGTTTIELRYDQVDYSDTQILDYTGFGVMGYGLGTEDFSWYTKIAQSEWKVADYIQLSYYFTVKDITSITAFIGDTPVPVIVENLFPNSAYENSSRAFVVTVDLRSVHDLSGTLEVGIDGTTLDIDGSAMGWYQMFNSFIVVTEPENAIIALFRSFLPDLFNALGSVHSELLSIDSRLDRFFKEMLPILGVVESIDSRVYGFFNFFQTTFMSYIMTLDSFLRSFWDNLRSFYDEVLETIGGFFQEQTDALLGDGSEADAFEEGAQQAQDQLQSANDSLNSIERPDPGEISDQIESVIPTGGVGDYGYMLTGVFSGDHFSTMLILVATCMLFGYVFFGKRG